MRHRFQNETNYLRAINDDGVSIFAKVHYQGTLPLTKYNFLKTSHWR